MNATPNSYGIVYGNAIVYGKVIRLINSELIRKPPHMRWGEDEIEIDFIAYLIKHFTNSNLVKTLSHKSQLKLLLYYVISEDLGILEISKYA